MSEVDASLLAACVQLQVGTLALVTPDLDGAVACSDDLLVGPHRLTVRAFVRPAGPGAWLVDLRDSSAACAALDTPVLDLEDVRRSAICAFADALRLSGADARLASRIELQVDAASWVGGVRRPCDAALRLFGMARVYDAIAGALALAWPNPGRAGSCSLGAIVIATDGEGGDFVDVVPGGRGAELMGPGESAWPGPLLPAGTLLANLGVDVEHRPRPASGGVGARNGGDGVIARYTFRAPAQLRIAIDRLSNPPHGLDRAGPPLSATVGRVSPQGEVIGIAPWQRHAVVAGDCIEVQTAGGAGHGFPGWGVDFDWE